MLKEEKVKIIKSTVPVLEQYGLEITRRFYELLFESHPELLNVFNQMNQKTGRQQTALANAVYAAAVNIDQLEKIIPVVKQIGHKHRSIGVKAEHYPVVGKYLLIAIKDVLKEAATEEILNAWGEAYGVIADAFIAVEKEMYMEAEHRNGGWKDYKAFTVTATVRESENTKSLYLKPVDGTAPASFAPGQYISVRVPSPDHSKSQIRQYSLSDEPNGAYYRITVKKESDSEQSHGSVSSYLHDHVQEGDQIEISAPAGNFIVDQKNMKPIVFISGGVGITPIMSMIKATAKEQLDRRLTLIHAVKNSRFHPFLQEVRDLKIVKIFTCYSEPSESDLKQQSFDKKGYITADWLDEIIENKDADYYVCGPIEFMKTIKQILKQMDISEAALHFELFSPGLGI